VDILQIAIIYETKRKKATVQIVEWLTNALKSLNIDVIHAFVVCKERVHPRTHLVQILEKLPTKPISEQCFEGYMLRKGGFNEQQSKAEE
jgi:hypothetical protein